MLMKVLLVILIILHLSQEIDSRGIWGSKRKREEVEANEEANDFSSSQSFLKSQAKRRMSDAGIDLRDVPTSMSTLAAKQLEISDSFVTLTNTFLETLETFIDSPEFTNIVTPEYIQTFFNQIPTGVIDASQVKQMLDSPQLQDPDLLRLTAKKGMTDIRAYAAQIIELLRDPKMLSQFLNDLPAELRLIVEKLIEGDTSSLIDLVDNIPGFTNEQKTLIQSMLSGNMDTSAIKETVDDIMNPDDDQIEAARLQFLENPELAEAFGIPIDVIEDKDKWNELMNEGLSGLNGLESESDYFINDEGDSDIENSLFSRS